MVAPFMHCYVHRQASQELTACPQLLGNGSVWSGEQLDTGPLSLEAGVLTMNTE